MKILFVQKYWNQVTFEIISSISFFFENEDYNEVID